jgi:hypothetical protein
MLTSDSPQLTLLARLRVLRRRRGERGDERESELDAHFLAPSHEGSTPSPPGFHLFSPPILPVQQAFFICCLFNPLRLMLYFNHQI